MSSDTAIETTIATRLDDSHARHGDARNASRRAAREEGKRKFLQHLRQTNGHVTSAATLTGIGRTTAHHWRKEDTEFSREWDEITGVSAKAAATIQATQHTEALEVAVAKVRDFSLDPRQGPAHKAATRDERKKSFVKMLRITGIVADAIRVSGVSRNSCRLWRNTDEVFARRWDDALEDYMDSVILREAHSRAVVGKSDKFLMALLQSHYPRFREQQQITVKKTTKVLVEWSDDEITRRVVEMAQSREIVDGEVRELDSDEGKGQLALGAPNQP